MRRYGAPPPPEVVDVSRARWKAELARTMIMPVANALQFVNLAVRTPSPQG